MSYLDICLIINQKCSCGNFFCILICIHIFSSTNNTVFPILRQQNPTENTENHVILCEATFSQPNKPHL